MNANLFKRVELGYTSQEELVQALYYYCKEQYNEGFKNGYEGGYKDGHKDGYTKGHEDGYAEGPEDGYWAELSNPVASP